MELSGFKGVEAALAELPKATSKNVVKRAVIEAAQPMADDMKAKAPRDEGDLIEGISVTPQIVSAQAGFSRRPGKQEVRAFVGPNYKQGQPGFAPHAQLAEFGTGPRMTKDGRSTGQMPARPFARPAYDGGKQGFIDRLGAALWTQIDKARARIARKNAKAGK